MRQHHAGTADTNALRGGGNGCHQHLRRGANDAVAVVMLGYPVAVVTERVAMARQGEALLNGEMLTFAERSGGLIEDGNFHMLSSYVVEQHKSHKLRA